MIPGISINEEYHTGNDGDFLLYKSDFTSPGPKLLTVDIPGANGLTDYTEHTGQPVCFGNRQLTFYFFTTGRKAEIERRLERLMKYHGQTVRVTRDDDPDYYYRGRAAVTVTERGGGHAYFTLSLDAFPYKLKHKLTKLNFQLEAAENIIIKNNIMPVFITAKVNSVTPTDSSADTLKAGFTYIGKTGVVSAGQTAEITAFQLSGGDCKITVSGGRGTGGGFIPYSSYAVDFQLTFREGKF